VTQSRKVKPRDENIPGQRLVSGFAGQRIVKLPADVIQTAARQPLMRRLLPTSVGFYPKAAGHLAARPNGVAQTIFIYCTDGRGWCDLAGSRHEIKAGQLLVIPENARHSYGAVDADPWSIRWLHVTGELLAAFRDALGVTREQPVVFLGEDTLMNELFEEVLSELESGYTTLNLIYSAQALAHLLGAMIRRRHNRWEGVPDSRQKVARCIQTMRAHLDRPLRMSQLAAMANLSVAHFTEVFKTQTGYAPKDYFTRLKMHQASQLLDSTELSVKEIAGQVGFEDALHFSRVFKRINQTSPSEHRLRRKA
jgi:AraC-like DNA-binding protein